MKSLIEKFKFGLQRTKTMLVRNIQTIFSDEEQWTDDHYERLEEVLIGADLGVELTQRVVDDIRAKYERGLIRTSADIIASSRALFTTLLQENKADAIRFSDVGPTVFLLVGVNGSGKTTTAGKLAAHWKAEGKTVLLAACDTFRAAAIEQLKIWGTRVDCPVVASQYGADAASVAYDAVNAAVARRVDILIIDTAGRQHTRKGLMDELSKITRITGKACAGAPHHTWLVVDGSTGTNALQQAREFRKSAELTGLCVTKLDGTSKGGVVVAIHSELRLSVHFVGLGEEPSDLQPFDSEFFADALFDVGALA